MLHYICALPDVKRPGRIPQLFSDKPDAIQAFIDRWHGVVGYSIYSCVGLLRDGARRRDLNTVEALRFLHVDVDFRSVAASPEEIDRVLRQLPLRPEVRDSGGGRHVVWWLKEPALAGTPEFARVNELRTQLTRALGGDPAPNHAAALLRAVGTWNRKHGEPRLCQIIQEGEPVDITELEELADLLDGAVLIEPLPAKSKGNGHDTAPPSGPERGPIDVDARLAAMQFKGPGDSAIHLTQLHCTASLLRSGCPVEDVVHAALEATRRAVADDPRAAPWDWAAEEQDIRGMCFGFINKNPELFELLPDGLRAAWEERLTAGRTQLKVTYAKHIGWHVRSKEPDDHGSAASEEGSTDTGEQAKTDGRPTGWSLYDHTAVEPPRWLIKGILPEQCVAIIPGQWGSYKTTTALEMALSVMTGRAFAGQYRIKRPGAVIYFAVEGAGTLHSRLAALAQQSGAPDKLPFAWRSDCPRLTTKEAGPAIVAHYAEAADYFQRAYGVPTVLVLVDTYAVAAGFTTSGDDNDTAATQSAFNALRFVHKHTGAAVVVVDHFGKMAEAGTRGSSNKEGNADAVLATLADKDLNGAVTNTRLAVRKQRDGKSGFEIPFVPQVIELGLDEDGDPVTAVVIDWGSPRKPRRNPKGAALHLCTVLAETLAKKGFRF